MEASGEVLDEINDVDEAADFLFGRLVATSRIRTRRQDTLRQRCDRVLLDAGVLDHVAKDYDLMVNFGAIERPLRFHYALPDNGQPGFLLQRVQLTKEQSVTSVGGKFQWIEQKNICPKERRFSLFDQVDEDDEGTVDFLGFWSKPINISDASAVSVLAELIK